MARAAAVKMAAARREEEVATGVETARLQGGSAVVVEDSVGVKSCLSKRKH